MLDGERRMELVNKAIDDFGRLLCDYRKEHFLTLQDMSLLVGCSPSYIHRIENKKRNPDMDFRIRILSAGMNWSAEDIYAYMEAFISKESKERGNELE
ncbi:helix-turn-helix transcriptional regulator [Oceanobacillus oncorhynchi]|uniref:helix-turn-helix transcriptional regulator n=1 Tax=Oceanobacillus oncorhynchi TaxID=545501 RepID=UPI0034D52643